MHPRSHFTLFLIASLAIHALAITAAFFLVKPAIPKTPLVMPVKIVDLPQQEVKRLPLVNQPTPVPPTPVVPKQRMPEKPLPPGPVPIPRKFGKSEEIKLPKTLPRTGVPEGAEQGKETGNAGTRLRQMPKEAPGTGGTGPIPFVTQKEIDALARKGMPQKKPGDDSVTLDTDEFKFISYNRWLKIKVESVLRYPELAAISGYQGTLYIKFDILKDGSLGGVEVLKSSGYKILDDEAVRSIWAAAPFSELPAEWNMERYSIRAAVIFYLNESYIQ
jgi:protein TonB